MRRPISIGFGALLLVCQTLLILPALAQDDAKPFDIPAQPLARALDAFATQSGMQMLYKIETVEGLTSTAVTGVYPPKEALDILLKGTGISWQSIGVNTATLERSQVRSSRTDDDATSGDAGGGAAASEKPIKVREVLIREARERDDATTYAADEASSATRLPAPLRDTPLSIDIITRKLMDDRKAVRIEDVIRNVSGTSIPHGAGGRAERFNIRGFTTDVNIFKNGFRDDSTFSSRTQREVANLQRIEVLKGPASFLYGRTDPGGIINLITKAPLSSPYYAGEMIFGSYNLYRPTVDFSGPLTRDKSLLYRFNGAYEHAHSFRDLVVSERFFAAPTFLWQLGTRTSLLFEGEFLYDTRPIDRGLLAVGTGVADIPVSRFLGDPSRRNRYNQGKGTLILRHEFSETWAWRSAFRAAVASEDYNSIEPSFLDTDNQTLFLAGFRIPQLVQSHYLQNEVIGKFETGPIGHRLLTGIELGRETHNTRVDFANVTTTQNIFNPVYSFNVDPFNTFFDGTLTNNIIGIYASDMIELRKDLKLTFGARFDIFDQRFDDRLAATETKQTDTFFNPMVGLVYQPIKPVSLYANYSKSARQLDNFSVFRAMTPAGTLPTPETARQYEAGIKTELIEGKLYANAAYFNIEKENVQRFLFTGVAPAFGDIIQTGEERSRGMELDVTGRVLPGWDVIATYAYIDAEISRGDAVAREGNTLPNAPLHSGSLWSVYTFQSGMLEGFGFGGGFYAAGRRQGDIDNTFQIPGFVRLDAALYYRKQEILPRTNLIASLNFRNLLDQRYFEGTQESRTSVIPGAPLTVLGAIKLEFY
ncbi:TonB-dependent siderophore receptor [Nitrospira moscoviensis]|uniref:Ferrichrome-iron receptor n=1 Tax=Nitrospira moscoviensis TaxID=42253 RepID=A0A0K2G8S1_NITMO|nr:TonB-dependent receptor [Nitrospira moscoviensis]ALA57335.1 Ferrichrome-iron receptor [Nitrospira moscoviensis]